jgi:2-hydroxy-3-keto-5-methylthiopentenyl-1-phosphate phosphatase
MPILVTDFDGTLARQDFYSMVLARLMPPGTPNHYAAYLRGEMTHFECLATYFASIRCSEAELVEMIGQMQLEPGLPGLLARLQAQAWEVIVASAGCAWYIEKLLSNAGVQLPVHASPGRWRGDGLGLEMMLPRESPFFSPTVGIDKSKVVRDALSRSDIVAFAGDGHTDVPAALLVAPQYRYAKDDCARELRRMGQRFQPFAVWTDVAEGLLASE